MPLLPTPGAGGLARPLVRSLAGQAELAVQDPPQVDIAAHRGGMTGPSENSLHAFSNAAALGVDLLELDVRRTSDGVLVIHHDVRVNPGIPGRGSGPKVSETPYASLPRLADGQRMATLAQVTDLARQRNARLVVELKEAGYEGQVLKVLRSRLTDEKFAVMSFHDRSVAAVEKLAPTLVTGLLTNDTLLHSMWRRMTRGDDPIKRARAAGADYIAMYQHGASDAFLNAARTAALPVAVWTVNGKDRIQRFLGDDRVTAVITDEPEAALGLRRLRNQAMGRWKT